MQRFVQYVTTFDPQFASKIEGATAGEIQQFEQAAGVPLPSSLRRFLEVMGHRDGGLRLAFEGTTDVGDLIDAYQKRRLYLPSNSVAFGFGGLAMDAVCLDLSGGAEPPAIFVTDGKRTGLYAESLPRLLFRTAFAKYRLPALAHSGYLGCPGGQSILEPVRAGLLREGFTILPFSDAIAICAERAGAAVIAQQYEGEGGAVLVGAAGAEAARQILDQIQGYCPALRKR